MKQKILVASTNPGKIKELSQLLGNSANWAGLSDFTKIGEIEEDGSTFAENARKKALGYAKKTGLWTLADDSGLMVDALDGQPGVKSARFSGTKSNNRGLIDHQNITKLLGLLKGVPAQQRTARFVCCLCLAKPSEVLIETQGSVEGIIIDQEKGTNGFGYDPVFFIPSLGKTVAELDPQKKNSISHRGNAIHKLKPLLEELLKGAK